MVVSITQPKKERYQHLPTITVFVLRSHPFSPALAPGSAKAVSFMTCWKNFWLPWVGWGDHARQPPTTNPMVVNHHHHHHRCRHHHYSYSYSYYYNPCTTCATTAITNNLSSQPSPHLVSIAQAILVEFSCSVFWIDLKPKKLTNCCSNPRTWFCRKDINFSSFNALPFCISCFKRVWDMVSQEQQTLRLCVIYSTPPISMDREPGWWKGKRQKAGATFNSVTATLRLWSPCVPLPSSSWHFLAGQQWSLWLNENCFVPTLRSSSGQNCQAWMPVSK